MELRQDGTHTAMHVCRPSKMTARLEAKIKDNHEDMADPRSSSIFRVIHVKIF
jgi:hypothetical protein